MISLNIVHLALSEVTTISEFALLQMGLSNLNEIPTRSLIHF